MSVINTNITSLIGQQNLTNSQNSLQTSMERLSSGLRINSAKDDAAGQAIANRMSSQIHGLQQAQRNANDGISVAQTAEGALNQVNDNLQRIRELSVQAQNGTNSQSDLQSIQDEIGQRLDEIDRISEETSFNGVEVLASDQELTIHVGANDGEAISISLEEVSADTLFDGANFNVNGLDFDALTEYADGDLTDNNGEDIDSANVTITDDATTDLTNMELEQNEAGEWFVTGEDADGNNVAIAVDSSNFDITDAAGGDPAELEVTINSEQDTLLQEVTANPLETLDGALNQVDSLRSELGAVQNRFEDAITNLSTTETNLQAARSRIEDADYAVEVADMTRSQILQQAGTSVLAQANQVPQSVLSLLG